MKRDSIEKYALLACPAFGLGVVITYQIGRYAALQVPIELLELNPVSTFLAALTITAFCLASIVTLAVIFQREDIRTKKHLPIYHLAAATMLTVPFWVDQVGADAQINWRIVGYILFATLVTYNAHKQIRIVVGKDFSEETNADKVYGACMSAFWLLLLVLISALALGGYMEDRPLKRTFIVGTNLALVGKFNGQLIFKPFPIKSSSSETVVLLPVDRKITLERRDSVPL